MRHNLQRLPIHLAIHVRDNEYILTMTSFHTFMNHGKEVWKLGGELDHLGIVLVM